MDERSRANSLGSPAFSRRTDWHLEPGVVSRAFAEARARGPVLDLTETNPTVVGLAQPAKLVPLLADDAGARYEPAALGLPSAREAIASLYRVDGYDVTSARIAISASTSEAYAWCFKLLADPGDEVLVPTPSYPLFDYLARLEGVRAAPYPLLPEEGFRVDVAELERRIGPTTRAIVVVHPNNPTGTLVREDDAAHIDEIAAARGLAVVSDEVFLDFVRAPIPAGLRASFVGPRAALTLVLGGLSKSCCSPQLKLGWTVVCGPDPAVGAALERLEVIADTYLSVSTPVQAALPAIFAARPAIQAELRGRVDENLATLDEIVERTPVLRRPASHGGWTALVQVPRVLEEETWVLRLALEHGVLVQPGYFFDLHDGGTLVLSLISPPDVFREGTNRLAALVHRVLG